MFGGGMPSMPDVPDVQDKLGDKVDLPDAPEVPGDVQDKLDNVSLPDEAKDIQEKLPDADDIPDAGDVKDKLGEEMEEIQEEEFDAAFEQIDKSGDGRVSKEELKKGIHYLGMNPTEERMDEMLEDVGDEGLNLEEFKEKFKNIPRQTVEGQTRELSEAFDTLDTSGDGKVDASEFKDFLGEKMKDDEVQDLIQQINPGGGGTIDKKAFLDYFVNGLRMKMSG